MFNDQCNTPPSSLQQFSAIVRAFLDELDTDELLDAHAGYQAFLVHFPTSEQADAFRFFWRSYPGFTGFEREYQARRFARSVALSNAGRDTPRSRWEAHAYAVCTKAGK
jgi:hypothetical protein